MYRSLRGRLSKSLSCTPKFLASTSLGVCANHSEIRKVLFSENAPSSNTSRNSHPSSSPWIECGIPAGKYQRSPTPTSSTKSPFGVNRGDARATVEHKGPLGLLVPMEFAHATRLQAHVYTGERRRYRQFASRYLARPAALLQAHGGVGERESETLGMVPRSVSGGRSMSGFCRSRTTLRGPGSLAPSCPLIGSGAVHPAWLGVIVFHARLVTPAGRQQLRATPPLRRMRPPARPS